MKTIALLLGTMALVGACSPMQSQRGNMVENFRMAEITPGISTRTNVLKSLGSPTTTAPFDDNVWYYIGQKMEKHGIFDPEVIEEKVVVVTFNEEGIVDKMQEIDQNRLNIPKSRDKTPTGGNEVTVIEQLLGNVGKFNRGGESAARTAGGT